MDCACRHCGCDSQIIGSTYDRNLYWYSVTRNRSRVRAVVEPTVGQDKNFRMIVRNFEALNHGVVGILAQRIA
jgi:hypothetical protein